MIGRMPVEVRIEGSTIRLSFCDGNAEKFITLNEFPYSLFQMIEDADCAGAGVEIKFTIEGIPATAVTGLDTVAILISDINMELVALKSELAFLAEDINEAYFCREAA